MVEWNKTIPNFLMILIIIVLAIAPVSAADWDNVKDYDEDSRTMTITNALGLGETLVRMQLMSDMNVKLGDEGEGIFQQVALIKLHEFKNDLPNAFSSMDIYDMNTGDLQPNREYKLKYRITTSEREENIIDRQCEVINNQSVCQESIAGTKIVEEYDWIEFTDVGELPKQNIFIGIYVDVAPEEYGEWIPNKWFGERIPEWASWTVGLNVDIAAVWKFDEGTGGAALSEVGGNNTIFINNGTWIVPGMESNALKPEGNFNITGTTFGGLNESGISISMWLVRNGTIGRDQQLVSTGAVGSCGERGSFSIQVPNANSDKMGTCAFDSASQKTASGAVTPDGEWFHVVMTINKTTHTIWLNGSLDINNAISDFGFTNSQMYLFGNRASVNNRVANFQFDEFYVWNRTLTDAEIATLYDGGTGTFFSELASANVTITAPLNQTYNVDQTQLNATIEGGTTDCWYSTDGGDTNTSVVCGVNVTGLSSGEGSSTWMYSANNSDNNPTNAYVTFSVDSASPELNITFPIDGSVITSGLVQNDTAVVRLNWTVSDTNLQSCFYYNQTANVSVTCGTNATFLLPYGTYTHFVYANDTSNNLISNSTTATYALDLAENLNFFNGSTYETAQENIVINMTYNSSRWTSTTGTLIYNTTSFAGTEIGAGDNLAYRYNFGSLGLNNIGNRSFLWQIGLVNSSGTTYINTTQVGQVVNPVNMSLCNGVENNSFMNFTFADENTLAKINATIPASTFSFWLGDGVINRTFSFSNVTANDEYVFCMEPRDRTFNVDRTLQYASNGYQQRTNDPDVSTFSNNTANITLYLLDNAAGLFVTFQVVNSAEQPVSGVAVNATRSISGTDTVVGIGTTNDAGALTLWLDPDFSHSFSFSRSGFDQLDTTFFPTETSYTINLGGGTSAVNVNDYSRGITYSIRPVNNTLFNGTTYNFDFELASTFWTVDEFGFVLKNTSATLSSNSATTNGGTVTQSQNTFNSSEIIMEFFWVVDGNYTNGTRTWYVLDDGGTDFSILNFFTDFRTYANSGMFGLTNFGLAIIVFLFIFVFTGVVSLSFGIDSPAAISALVFIQVLMFDVGFNMMSFFNPFNAVQYFPTIFVGVITAAIFFREVYR